MLRRFSLAALLLAAAVTFSGCSSSNELVRPPQNAIDAYLLANPGLPAVDQSCIADGRFEIGMLAETVRFLLGDPPMVEEKRQPWARQEIWRYGKKSGKGKTRVFIIEDKHVVGIDETGSAK